MSVRVRLTRVGSRKNPIWRVVVADQRSPRDGRVIESIGHYNPQTEPSTIVIDRDRLHHWIEHGAEPTNTVRKLMRAENTVPAMAQATEPAPGDAEPAPADAGPGAGDAEPAPADAQPGAGDAERGAAEVAEPASEAPSPGEDAAPSAASAEPAGESDTPAG